MGFSSGRACLEIRVEKNEPRSHFGSNGALRGKQERGGQAELVWLPLRLARSGPDHNMETDSARSAADSTPIHRFRSNSTCPRQPPPTARWPWPGARSPARVPTAGAARWPRSGWSGS